MKRILTIVIVFIAQIAFSQEPFLSFDQYLGENAKKPKQLFSTYISENNSFLVFIEDKKQLHIYLFDKDGNEISEGFSIPNVAKKLPNIAGYTFQDGQYIIYLSTSNKRKWAIATLDFAKKSYAFNELTEEITGDRVLQSVPYSDHLFLFTVERDTSTIIVYKINPAGNIQTVAHSFEDTDFSEGRKTLSNIDRLIQSNSLREATVIDNNSPIALESSKSRVKLYQDEQHVTITLDASKNFTYCLNFNLDDESSEVRVIEKSAIENEVYKTKSNSFLFDNKLFVFKSSSEEMDFSIFDIKTLEKKVSYTATKDAPIPFKNTPIIQEDDGRNTYIEYEKTAKFLRQVAASNPAISVFKENQNYIITLGATAESTPSPALIVIGGGLGGAVASGIISGIANSSLYQYNAYSNSRSTRFQLVLNEDLQFMPDSTVPLNSFDHIKGFTQDTPVSVLQTVSKISDNIVWGALNNKNQKINFFTF